MKITIEVKDSKVAFFMELLQNFDDFISVENYNEDLSDAHKELLDARLTQYENNPTSILDWKDVQNEVEQSL